MQEETYIGLSSSKNLKIFNRSDYIVKYRWMKYKDDEYDRIKKEKYKKIFETVKNFEAVRCMDLVHYNICMPDAHELVCQRIYSDEISSLMKENFFYNDIQFTILPMEGEIWPRNSIDATINFEPNEIGEISSIAYLEVTGRESRIPLSLSGISIGPLLKLNVSTIDVENIFLCSVHNYEVVCTNNGSIPGALVHRRKRSDFGGKIEVTPERLKLLPGQYKSFNITFSSNRNGDFVECVEFVVRESLRVVPMFIKGRVVCPTLHFDKGQLDFGTLAIGFAARQEATLYNDSLVPVTFSIGVPDDGNESVVTHDDFAKSQIKPLFPSSPQEFTIIPKEGIVDAQSSLKIVINLTPNLERIGKTSLQVDMWDTDSIPVSLPITYRSVVATMMVKPAEIAIRFCFLNYPYSRNLLIENTSSVDGYFYLIPQAISDDMKMFYSMSMNEGYLAAGQSKSISIEIITRTMGKQEFVLKMLSFGKNEATACCTLTCNGQGPVISVEPSILDFSNVDILKKKTMNLTLISDSPVPAEFRTSLSSKDSCWTIIPNHGNIDPGQSIQLQVSIFLRDVGKHEDKINVAIINGRTVIVSLHAIGIGSCVVSEPSIFPVFDMGSLFSRQVTNIPIDLSNEGSRNLKLIFFNSMEIKMVGGQLQSPICDKFSIEPFVFDLPARGKKKIFVNAQSNACGAFSEQWWLHCYFEGQGKREIIGSSKFTTIFVEPLILFNKKELLFRLDMKNKIDESLRISELIVTNESGQDLNTRLNIDPPFGIITEHEDRVQLHKIILPRNTENRIRIFFSSTDENSKKRYSQNFLGILKLEYDEHPNVDRIKCLATVNFPNIENLPKEIHFNCPLACSAMENIFLTNNGPLDVSYKFIWIDESVSINRDFSTSSEEENLHFIKSKIEDDFDDSDFFNETKKFFFNIVGDDSITEKAEDFVLQCLSDDPPMTDFLNETFSIVPSTGIVPAFSSKCVSIGFHIFECINLRAQLNCEIDGGPSESIEIFGAVDVVKFRLDKDRIDFGQQMIFEEKSMTIKLENLSRIDFSYHIEMTNPGNECLEIRPKFAKVSAQSNIDLEIISRPSVPGIFEKSFILCVQNVTPVSITVEGISVISQIYIGLPRKNLFDEYPIELGYEAVRSLANSFDHNYENENDWEIITNDNNLPNIMDIEMAIERLMARNILDETYYFKDTEIISTTTDSPIPYLVSPEYILDLGYVIVGQSKMASTRVYNYGTRSARVRLKTIAQGDNLAKQGITIHFRDKNLLMPGDFADLQISFKPMLKLKASEKSLSIKKKIYLEVSNGFTLPIIISARVTIPCVDIYPKSLEFSDVLIGECVLMYLLVKNRGLIDCSWEAKLPPVRRNQPEGPFTLQNDNDFYSSGQFGTIKVYFQPRKSGYFETQIEIKTHTDLDPTFVIVRGRGIEHKLKISEPSINFNYSIPYEKSDGKILTVENIGQRSVELFWQHLDKLFLEEDRLIRVLTHYYQVHEILLPVRKIPATLPYQLYNFYNWLVNEMTTNLASHRQSFKPTNDSSEIGEFEDHFEDDRKISTIDVSAISRSSKRSRVRKSDKISKKLRESLSNKMASSDKNLSIVASTDRDILREENNTDNDPDEMENHLHHFINDLQKQTDFREKMRDPVKEIFDELKRKDSKRKPNDSFSTRRNKRICIFFHGSSHTEYQQIACKTSRVLGLPLLNLNNAIAETIALGNTVCSAKLREIIDTKYRKLLSSKDDTEDEKSFYKIEELNTFDSLTRYEYKIEKMENNYDKNDSISENNSHGGKRNTREGERNWQSPRLPIEETFLDIDIQLLLEILEQRLSMKDLKDGFILQTLKNRFIPSETKILSSLLQILGDVKFPLFVTFDKSRISHEFENHSLSSNVPGESVDEDRKKLTEIDEMSLAEFDNLSDSDKNFYREKILYVRSKNALEKQKQFLQRLSELRKKKKLKNRGSSSRSNNKYSKNLSKSYSFLKSEQTTGKSVTPEMSSGKKNEKAESPKDDASKTIPNDNPINSDENQAYSTSLESILLILQNWDPIRKKNETGTSRISKNLRNKERSQTVIEKPTNKFWIWHVRANDPENLQIFDMIVNELKKNKKILLDGKDEEPNEEECEMLSEIYSVVRAKNRSQIPKIEDEIFELFALGKKDSSNTDSLKNRLESLESRFVLEPHEYRKFEIFFTPKILDLYHQTYTLGLVNCNDFFYSITVTGFGDIPRLNMDPCRIFKKVKRMKENDLYDPTFFEDTQTFDFGSLLLTGDDNRVHRKKATFKFWNISKIDLEVEFSLVTNDTKIFDVEPKKLFIKANEFGVVQVTSGVTKLGNNEDRLILLIKDNPRVETIELRNNGTKLDVEIEGKDVSVGRVLLYRKVYKNLKIRNNSAIPIFWKFLPPVLEDSQFRFTPSMGWTKGRAESEVVFTFLANRIGTMEKTTMELNFFLNDKDEMKEALLTEIITITGETYDVAIDVDSANPINLGTVKVGSITNVPFNIKNRGQYDVKFVIEFEKNCKSMTQINRELQKNLMEDLRISPSTGNLLPDKIATINVNFQPKFEMRLREIDLLRCNLIDAGNSATVVAEFPLSLSITTHYAKFLVIPDNEINFGPMRICDDKTLHLSIKNIGYFSIKYQIRSNLLSTVIESSRNVKKDKNSRNDSKRKGTSKSHETLSNLRLGAFTIFDIEGNIEPTDTKTLSIDCYPEIEGNLEEKIFVNVDDSSPENQSGKCLLLKVDSRLPFIDFHDLDAIFSESFIVDDVQDFQCPKDIDSHTVFSRVEKCLYFERVNIHKTHTASIKLHNRSLVSAKVTVFLRPDVLTPANAKPDTFALDTVQEYILPMSSRIFSVSFTPSLIETFTGVLEAQVELPPEVKQDSKKLSIKLSGEGCVPEVSLIEPQLDKRTGKSFIRFGRCLVDEIKSRNLCFKNIGKIIAKIIIGIHNDDETYFGVRKFEDSTNSMEMVDDCVKSYEGENRNIVWTLNPEEIARFVVDFHPKEIGKKKAELHLHVLDNPYENMTLEIDGEGFVENVVLVDLPLVEIPKSNKSDANVKTRKSMKNRGNNSASRGSSITIVGQNLVPPILIYSLDYSTCFVNKMSKLNFKIVNKSQERYFRFDFPSHPNLVFVPSIGHLERLEKKEITANFFATEPMIHKETILECSINEIRFPDKDEEIKMWDDRQTSVEWVEVVNSEDFENEEFSEETTKEKIIVPTKEPNHEVLAGTFRTIQLIFSAIAAYTEYSCVVKEIHFKDTLMFQNREYTFAMENTGNVDLVFNWTIEADPGYPTRLSENSLRSKIFRPQSRRSNESRPNSRSSAGILYPDAEEPTLNEFYTRYERGDELLPIDVNPGQNCRHISSREKSFTIDVKPYECSCASDLFSDSLRRTQRSSENWTEYGDDEAFNIKPRVGLIPPKESLQFSLRFSPLDVFDYKACLNCRIENLNPNAVGPNILVTARSLLPYCHFDIEESDYLTSGRRTCNLDFTCIGGGDSNEHSENFGDLRVVEFNAIGIGESHVKEFHLINPTLENYRFTWKDLTSRRCDELPFFHCAYEEGTAESGKRTNVIFSFFAEEIGTFEAFWCFSIERYNLQTHFLLVANITEPSVHFSESRLKMKPTIVGNKIEDCVTIINNEKIPFSWKILPNTLHSLDGTFQKLQVSQMSGILGPTSQQILRVSLLPNNVGDFTFSLQCQLKRMKNPLGILVTAKVAEIISRISYTIDKEGQEKGEIYYDRENILDLGNLSLAKPATIKFDISNMSDITFHYSWDLGLNNSKYFNPRNETYLLTISKESERISGLSTSTCNLELTALRKKNIRQHPLILKIDGGPTYRIFLKASSKIPSIEFNFIKYDFGPCYIRRGTSSSSYVVQLFITNNDKTPAVVECTFENSPNIMVTLEALSQAIPGNSTIIVPIKFRPTEILSYQEDIIFLINDSVIQQNISIKGEGIPYKISLENVGDKYIDLGNVPIGKIVNRKIRVLNSGRASAELLFGLIKNLPGYEEGCNEENSSREVATICSKTLKENSPRFQESNDFPNREDNYSSDMLSIQPDKKILLGAGKSIEIIVRFVPTRRIGNFIEKIGVQADTTIFPLFVIRGSCVAREFNLDRSHLYFGTIVEGCTSVTKIMLRNNGDFGSKFKWNIAKLMPHFDLKPISGYCSPGMDVTFDVIFHPKQTSSIHEAEAFIEIEKYSRLKIKCSGVCCKIPDPVEDLKFTVSVRSAQTKNLTITNDTSDTWFVETTCDGIYFQTEDKFIVPAKGSYSCKIIYNPMVMNTEMIPHRGRLIIKLPKEKPPLVYSLTGVSTKPEMEGKIVRQLPAKTKYVELLPVRNWTDKPQSFLCDIRSIDDQKVNPVLYSFTGNSRLDVQANGTRDYRALFYCYKETNLNFRITFTKADGEYQFYEIQYKVTKPDILSTIKLTCPARSCIPHQLEIENPLEDKSVTFTAICQCQDINVTNVPKILVAGSKDKIIIEYSPLIPAEIVTRLDLNCSELGNFPYELKLKATAPPAEKITRVTAMLGASINFSIGINNMSKKNTEFLIKVDDPSFTCKEKISVGPQKSNVLEVNYEPCDAKNVKTMLRATSESLGEFCFPIIGSYVLPKPQGPFSINQNSTINITFKNVSTMTRTFFYAVEGSNDFSIPTSSEIIKSKSTTTIPVKFSVSKNSSKEDTKYPSTGKLIVSYVEPSNSQISWTYYLRGVRE